MTQKQGISWIPGGPDPHNTALAAYMWYVQLTSASKKTFFLTLMTPQMQ